LPGGFSFWCLFLKKERSVIDENAKDKDLEVFREDSKDEFLTTNEGVRVSHTDDSLKAGLRGPTLMEDFHFREKLTHFDHERIPERVVHARGSGAHGYFEVYESLAEFTKAKFLQEPNKKTPVFVRFSTVVGFRGSADTVRDVRGFATKFYTEDGIYDLVGNNIPVFFIQDAIKFPDLVHAIKPEQDNEMPQASAAHDTFWDFVAHAPENAHMIMWLLSDRGIPRSYRMMDGFSVNTFRFVNAQGKARFVKLLWKPLLGTHSLVWDEAQKIAGKDADFHRRDLWEAIEMGDYPEFELYVQMIEEEDEFKFDFDILDPTKVWPEELVVPKKIGKLVLNRNPDNFFAETEQVAFHPGNVVPGIDFSNDPLLQGRLFSYLDTQLIRLGGPNFVEIPINRSIAPVHNNQRDGYHRMTINKGKTNYFPNSIRDNDPKPAPESEQGYVHYAEKVEGKKVRERSESFKEFYRQASMFYNSMTEAEKEHIVKAFHFEIGKVESKEIRQKLVELFSNVDTDLAAKIAKGVGVEGPSGEKKRASDKSSPAVSMDNTVKDTIKSRRVAVLVNDGVKGSELMQVRKALEDAGAHIKTISMNRGVVKSAEGEEIIVDKNYVTTGSIMFDAVYVPGGNQNVEALKKQGDAVHFVNEAFKHCKPIGATSEGVDLLKTSDIGEVNFESADQNVVSNQGVVTATNQNNLTAFIEQFKTAIAQHRHWNRPQKTQIPA
jgi:catalase